MIVFKALADTSYYFSNWAECFGDHGLEIHLFEDDLGSSFCNWERDTLNFFFG